MNSTGPGPIPSPDESEAIRVLLTAINAEDATIAWIGQVSSSRTYDAELRFSNGATAAVEITSHDDGFRNLASVQNKFYATDATNNAWQIKLTPHSADGRTVLTSQHVRTIVKEIDPILSAIEREYQDGVNPRLFDPRLYNDLFQAQLRPSTTLSVRIAGSRPADNDHPAGVTILLRPTASLILDNTDILANKVQNAIDKKHERDQGATWLIVHMRDYGGAADQLRDLQATIMNQPSRTEHLDRIDLKCFDKVFIYTRIDQNYAFLSIDRSSGWTFTTVSA